MVIIVFFSVIPAHTTHKNTMSKIYQPKCYVVEDQPYFKIVLGKNHAPIGQRLSKRDPLPDWPILYDNKNDAERMANRWTEYIQSQNSERIKKWEKKQKKKRRG